VLGLRLQTINGSITVSLPFVRLDHQRLASLLAFRVVVHLLVSVMRHHMLCTKEHVVGMWSRLLGNHQDAVPMQPGLYASETGRFKPSFGCSFNLPSVV